MPEFLLICIITISIIVAFIMAIIILNGVDLSHFNKKDKFNFIGVFVLLIGLIVAQIKWLNSGDVKLESTKYINIQRNGDIKYYVLDNRIIQIDRYIDDKEYCVKLDNYVGSWVNGIYYHLKANSHTTFVPIKEMKVEVK
jgi:hypothetical protein